MTHFSDSFLEQVAGTLYHAVFSNEIAPGFTVGDIVRANLPGLHKSDVAKVALQQLIEEGIIGCHVEQDKHGKVIRYFLKAPRKEEPKEQEVKKNCGCYQTRELRAEKPAAAKQTQVGGNHYVNMTIQPIDYITKNGLGFLEGNVVKYVSRWKAKGGVEDLRKAKHYLDMLIEGQAQ